MALFEFHIHNHVDTTTIVSKLDLIIKKQSTMNEQAQEIIAIQKATMIWAEKVAADVTLLHKKIDALPSAPSPAEVAEIKELSTTLHNRLQGIDAQTEDETTPEARARRGNSGKTIS